MKKIVFFNHKGGVGKSTLTAVIANILSNQKKVLIIDLDEQSCLSQIFNKETEIKTALKEKSKSPITIGLMGYATEKDLIFNINKNLDLIVNNSGNMVNDIVKKEQAFNLKSFLSLEKYDYVFFDLPPVLNETLLEVLRIVDEIYLVLDCEKASSSTAKILTNYLADQDVDTRKIKATIPNKYLYIHKREHDKVIDDFTLELDNTVETLSPIKNKIAIKDKDRLAEYEEDFAEIIKLIKKGNK